MSNLPKSLISDSGQQAQLSWLQSCDGEWFYFLDDNAIENHISEKSDQDYIWLVCQKKSSNRVSGYRIENHILEALIEQLAAVKQAVVFGVPHEHKGNGIYVHVELNNAAIELAILSQAISAKLVGFFGDFARPEAIKFVDELPVLNNKKIRRQIVKSQEIRVHCAA